MTHRDGVPRFSARSARRGDAGHREARATPSESLGKPPSRSHGRTAGGRRKALPMPHIAGGLPPTRRIAHAISMDHYQRSLVLAPSCSALGEIGPADTDRAKPPNISVWDLAWFTILTALERAQLH